MTDRRPTEGRSPRMEALSRLPIFMSLEGKRAVVVGSGRLVGQPAQVWLESQGADVRSLGEATEARLGPIAVWINNAGLARHRWIPDYTEEEIRKIFHTIEEAVSDAKSRFLSRARCDFHL